MVEGILEGIILLSLAIQDWRERKVSIYLLAFLFGLYLVQGIHQKSIQDWLFNWNINLIVLGIQMIILFLYFSWKERRWISLADRYIGVGDLVFFIILASHFSPLVFSWVYLGSLIFTILGVVLYYIFYKKALQPIPLLSGVCSFILLLLLFEKYLSIPAIKYPIF